MLDNKVFAKLNCNHMEDNEAAADPNTVIERLSGLQVMCFIGVMLRIVIVFLSRLFTARHFCV